MVRVRTAETYRGYEVVETDWTTEVRTGSDRTEVRPVYVIPGMKERPSSPYLTTVQEARDYIDEELAGREVMREARTATFEASVKVRGAASLGVTIPASASRALGLDVGDRVRVTVEKLARRGRGEKGPRKVLRPYRMRVPGRTGDAPGRTRHGEDGAGRLIEQGRAGHGKAREVVRRGVDGGGAWINATELCARAPQDAEQGKEAVRKLIERASERVEQCVCDVCVTPSRRVEREIGGREDCSERSPRASGRRLYGERSRI